LIVLLVAAIARSWRPEQCSSGPPADRFSVFGCHPTGSAGTLFLFGIAVGAVASLWFGISLAGPPMPTPTDASTGSTT